MSTVDVLLRFRSDTSGLNRGMQGVSALTRSMSLFRALAPTLGFAGISAGVLAFGRNALTAGTRLADLKDALGLTAEELQFFEFAAGRAGLKTEAGAMVVQRFSRRLADARKGTGELLPVLREYGITLTDADGRARSATEIFGDLAEVIKATQDPGERLRIAFKAFDSEGARMVGSMKDGKEGLQALQREFDATNPISTASAQSLREVSNTLGDITTGARNAGVELMGQFASGLLAVRDLSRQSMDEAELSYKAMARLLGEERRPVKSGRGQSRANDLLRRRFDSSGFGQAELEAEKRKIIGEQLAKERAELQAAMVAQQEKLRLAQEEEERRQISLQLGEAESRLEEVNRDIAFSRMEPEEKLLELRRQRVDLESRIDSEALGDREKVELLKEYESTLRNIAELENAMAEGGSSGGIASVMEQTSARVQVLNSALGATASSIGGLIQGTMTWGNAFRSVGRAIVQTLVQIGMRMLTNYIMSKFFSKEEQKQSKEKIVSNAMEGGTKSIAQLGPIWGVVAFAAAIAGIFALMSQFRENGGGVRRGAPYVVGERRPEVFIPNQDGRIVPTTNGFNGFEGGGGASGAKPVVNIFQFDSEAKARRYASERGMDAQFIDLARRNRYALT